MDFKYCSYDCPHARAIANISASNSSMNFNAIYCKELQKPISNGEPCPLVSMKPRPKKIKTETKANK